MCTCGLRDSRARKRAAQSVLWLLLVGLLLGSARSSLAQATAGTILGRVLDPQRALVPGATRISRCIFSIRDRFLASGMDDYVSKPIRPDQLFAAIERLTSAAHTDAEAARPEFQTLS